jgi:hypothetical protein
MPNPAVNRICAKSWQAGYLERWVASQLSLTVNVSQSRARFAHRGLRGFGEGKKVTLRGSSNGPPNNSLQVSAG